MHGYGQNNYSTQLQVKEKCCFSPNSFPAAKHEMHSENDSHV